MSAADLVIRNGTVVSAESAGLADVVIAGGRVQALAEPGTPLPGDVPALDATGRLVLPGGVDPHCHVGFTSGAFTSLDDYGQASMVSGWPLPSGRWPGSTTPTTRPEPTSTSAGPDQPALTTRPPRMTRSIGVVIRIPARTLPGRRRRSIPARIRWR